MAQPRDLEHFRSYIKAALEHSHGSHTFEDVVDAVAAGQLQFWPGKESVILTELIAYPQYKQLHFFVAGGNLAELMAMVPLVEEWGKSQGCTRASLVGRKGWERTFLSRTGWGQALIVMEKQL